MPIVAAVGPARPNRAPDVRTVQQLLNRAGGHQIRLKVDGLFGPRTAAAISRYQANVLRFRRPDGVVDPGGPTLRMLGRQPGGNTTRSRPIPRRTPAPPPRPSVSAPGTNPAAPPAAPTRTGGVAGPGGLTEETYIDMAARLDCEVAAIKAIVETEVAIRGPFDKQGRPTILFERHKFHRHTGGRYDRTHPDISNPNWGGYGKFSAQYEKLEQAMKLDHAAGLKSCSWGAFQILGENHVQAGHATVDSFVAAMRRGILPQAEAFVSFVLNDRRLLAALRQRNWATFARIYNGPAYKDNDYDGKMRANYQRFAQ
ncbi:DUF3380 domain-containing protein [Sphingomonas sp. NBWT7]|uniref:N-acetylmuramidase domain-containing protein n=1 Tax=Sphingomonas sp. NBWT7 TaxID=2596913 RepID=UPI0016296EF2|nr:N-acetylmuramidase family protein [Sphingomonas sp. NBWT7]QNE32477.1 DUF3380 domain-containing protein [Sphingomonas sp. NBWT7]